MSMSEPTEPEVRQAEIVDLPQSHPASPPAIRSSGVVDHRLELSSEDLTTLRDTYAADLNESEFRLFVSVAQAKGLSPLAGQIHGIVRNKNNPTKRKLTIQTSIDGFRLIAQRTGQYQGQAPHEWLGADGQWRDVWIENQPPKAARATVFRAGHLHPSVAVATWDEYCVKDYDGSISSMWQSRGAGQLAKCAEALAFRKAFPEDLSGTYTDDEMGQADNNVVEGQLSQPAPASQQTRQPNSAQNGAISYTTDQQALKTKIEQLTDEQRGEFAAWWKEKNYPHLSKANKGVVVQGDRKLELLRVRAENEAPFPPSDEEPKVQMATSSQDDLEKIVAPAPVNEPEPAADGVATYVMVDQYDRLSLKATQALDAWLETQDFQLDAVPSDKAMVVDKKIDELIQEFPEE